MDITLTSESIVEHAQHVLRLIACEWAGCEAKLNSWQQLQEHLKMHCQNQRAKGTYDCHFHKCAGRIHTSFVDLWEHVRLSHLSRITLLCPISGCPHTFSGHHSSLTPHIHDIHMELVGRPMAEITGRLRPTYRPFSPVLHNLPPLPSNNVPIYMVTALPMSRASHSRGQRSEMLSQFTRRSRRMSWKELEDEEDEEDVQPFSDLHNPDMEAINLSGKLILQPRSEQPWLQLSRPYSMGLSSRVEGTKPPVSISYGAFCTKFHGLEEAALIDGTGEWPDAEEEKQ